MKKIIISLIILITAIIIGFIFLFPQYISSPINILINEKLQINSEVIQEKQITDNTKPFTIDIKYPFIAGANDFNKKVENIINKEIEDFKKNSLENDNAVKETDPVSYAEFPREYDLNIGYDKGQVDKNIASVIFNIYNFTGGAHGSTYFISLNYDLKNKKEIRLADIFSGDSNYLQKVSDFCKADLVKQLTTSLGNLDGTWIDEGAGTKEENFKYFLINKDSITFYFPQYQVAFYAAGDFKVVMPR